MSDTLASRATVAQARAHFDRGGAVLVAESGHLETRDVTAATVTHTRDRITWDELARMVAMWRNRHPGQTFYVVAEILECGHAPTVADGIGTGYGTDPATGARSCYPCAERLEMAAMVAADAYVGYLSTDARTVTTWTGGQLARVTRAWDSRAARRTYVHATAADGSEWHGSGPLEAGTYVTLHRRKGAAGQPRELAAGAA